MRGVDPRPDRCALWCSETSHLLALVAATCSPHVALARQARKERLMTSTRKRTTESKKGVASDPTAWARRRYPIAFERLRKLRIGRLDRECRMTRERFTVRTQSDLRGIPGKWTHCAASLSPLSIAVPVGADAGASGSLVRLLLASQPASCTSVVEGHTMTARRGGVAPWLG